MEEEIVDVLNVTEYEKSREPGNYATFTWVLIAASVVALISDVLIVTTILRVRRLQNRRNFILMHYAAIDIAFIVFTKNMSSPVMYLIFNIRMHQFAQCTISNTDATFLFAEFLFILTLLSNNIMNSKTVSIDRILKIVYGIVILFVTVSTGCCVALNFDAILHFLDIGCFIFLLLQVIIRDVVNFYNRRRSPLSPDTSIRLNIGRIYTFNLLIAIICIFSFAFISSSYRIVFKYFALTGFLGSFYILLYLISIDSHFKGAIVSLFRKNSHKIDECEEVLEDIPIDRTMEI